MVWSRWLIALTLVSTVVSATPTGAVEEPAVPLNDCARPENGSPVVTSVQVEPSRVDVTRSPAAVTVTVAAEDTGGPGPASGVSEVRIGLGQEPYRVPVLPRVDYPSEDGAVAELGTDGLWRATLTVPRGLAPGAWVPVVQVVDRMGWRHAFHDPTGAAQSGLTIDSVQDTEAPVLTGFSLSPRSVDTRREPKAVTVTATFRESGSGLARVGVVAGGRDAGPWDHVELSRLQVGVGWETWRGKLRIPRWAGSHRWQVSLAAVDLAGNLRSSSRPSSAVPDAPDSIAVRSRTDLERPSIAFRRVRPRVLDVRERDGSLRVRVRVQDPSSGVRAVTARLGPEDNGPPEVYRLRRVSGGARDGVWRGSIPVRRCQAFDDAGTVRVTAVDRSGRVRSAHSARQGGFPLTVRWADVYADYPEASEDGLTVDFPEAVVGIGSQSAVLVVGVPERVVTGTWACQDATGAPVDCYGGPVRHARLQVADPGALPARGEVRLNPEHTLDVRDLAGNPFYRLDVSWYRG